MKPSAVLLGCRPTSASHQYCVRQFVRVVVAIAVKGDDLFGLRQHDNGRAVVEQAPGFAEGGRISGVCGFIFLTVCSLLDKTSAD